MNMKKTIFTSALALVVCLSMLVGATFALFTSESNTDITVSSGTVDVDANITLESVYSPAKLDNVGQIIDDENVAIDGSTFYNRGTVSVADGNVTLNNMTPGDKAIFKVTMTNQSSVSFMQRMLMNCTDEDSAFFNELLFGISDAVDGTYTYYSNLTTAWESSATVYGDATEVVRYLSIEMPGHVKNKWQGQTCNVAINVMAVQGNAETVDGVSNVIYMVNDQATLDEAIANIQDGETIYVTAPVAGELSVATDAAMSITIRGYIIDTLTVNAPNATVHVYNDVTTLNGDAIAHHSIYVYGDVASLTMKTGRVIVAADASVSTLTLSAAEGENITVDVPTETSVVHEIVVDGEDHSTVQINVKKEVEETPIVTVTDENKSEVTEVEFNEYPGNVNELIAMIDNAKDGDIIILSSNVVIGTIANGVSGTQTPIISIKKSLTIDMNGMTISISDEAAAKNIVGIPVIFSIENNANVVLKNGTIDAEAGNNGCYAIGVNGGNLTIEGGVYTGAPTAVQVTTGNLTINGGTFSLAESCNATAPSTVDYLINCIDENYVNGTATISITGGNFKGYNPANNASEGEGTNYVSRYSEVSENNGVYTVVETIDENVVFIRNLAEFKAFRDSVNAGNKYAGKTVVLTADIDLNNEEWTPIGSSSKPFSGSFDGQGHTVSNLKITKTIGNIGSSNRQGLFSTIVPSGATFFENLTVHNADITAGYHVGAVVATSDGSSQTKTNNYLVMRNINLTGKVTIEGWEGVAGVMGSGNMAEISNIVVDVEEGSYVSTALAGRENSFNCLGSVKGGGYLEIIDNIESNLDVIGNMAGIGGLFGVVGGQNVVCHVSNVSYSGKVTAAKCSTGLQWNYGCYCYNGLLIGSARFKLVADQATCTSTGELELVTEEGIKTSNDMGDTFTWGADLFGASRDNDYTNKSYAKAYVTPAETGDVSIPADCGKDYLADEAEEAL